MGSLYNKPATLVQMPDQAGFFVCVDGSPIGLISYGLVSRGGTSWVAEQSEFVRSQWAAAQARGWDKESD